MNDTNVVHRITLVCLLIGIAVCASAAPDYTEFVVSVKHDRSIKEVTDATRGVIAKKVASAAVYLLRTARQNEPLQVLAEIRQIPAVESAEENSLKIGRAHV